MTINKPFVAISKGMRGYFAVHYWWNNKDEEFGFYEPWESGIGSYATAAEAEPEAKAWAADLEIEFQPRTSP